jgi:hypothetical protein
VEKQVAASASFPNPEKYFERAHSQRLPDPDHFIGDAVVKVTANHTKTASIGRPAHAPM